MVTTEDPIELHGQNNAGRVISYECADGTGIPIHTPLKLSNPRTVAASDGASDIFAGVASSEKAANDGETNIGAYTLGVFVFEVEGGQSVSTGDVLVTSSEAGKVVTDNTENNPSKIVGYALDDSSDSKVSVRINK